MILHSQVNPCRFPGPTEEGPAWVLTRFGVLALDMEFTGCVKCLIDLADVNDATQVWMEPENERENDFLTRYPIHDRTIVGGVFVVNIKFGVNGRITSAGTIVCGHEGCTKTWLVNASADEMIAHVLGHRL